MNPAGRSRRALRGATPPTVMSAVIMFLIVAGHIVKGDSIAPAVAVGLGLIAVVFFTYFGLGLAGFRVKSDDAVQVPRRYSWLLVGWITIVTIVVMATAFYLAARFGR